MSHLKDARVHCVVLKVRAVPSLHTEFGSKEGPEVGHRNKAASGPSGPNSVHVPAIRLERFQLQAAY